MAASPAKRVEEDSDREQVAVHARRQLQRLVPAVLRQFQPRRALALLVCTGRLHLRLRWRSGRGRKRSGERRQWGKRFKEQWSCSGAVVAVISCAYKKSGFSGSGCRGRCKQQRQRWMVMAETILSTMKVC
eukprot:2350719-Pleurochrysis_carterae.AAC.1